MCSQAIRQIKRELRGRMPLIGFAGAPFTLASYAIEGGHSNNFAKTKAMMYGTPDAWHRLCDLFADMVADYLDRANRSRRRRRAGVRFVGRRAERARLPGVHPSAHQADLRRAREASTCRRFISASAPARFCDELREAGGDVIGADWRTPLDEAWERIGFDRAVQGNLDPTLLLGPIDRVLAGADDVLARAGGRPGHIFNLGHGILPLDAGRARPGARALRSPTHTPMTGVLLMAHGTPSSMDEMPEYLRLVRGGRPPSPELIAEMRHNYEAIGGKSPLDRADARAGRGALAAARTRGAGRRRHAQLETVPQRRDRRTGGEGRPTDHRASRSRRSFRR